MLADTNVDVAYADTYRREREDRDWSDFDAAFNDSLDDTAMVDDPGM